MTTSLRRFALCCGLPVALVLVVCCNVTAVNADLDPAKYPQITEVNSVPRIAYFDMSFLGPMAEVGPMDTPVAAFLERHPSQRLAIDQWVFGDQNILTNELGSGWPASAIIHASDDELYGLRDLGKFHNLTKIFQELDILDGLPKAVRPLTQVANDPTTQVMIPTMITPNGMVCHKDTIQGSGVTTVPTTWSEFVSFLEAVQTAPAVSSVIGVGRDTELDFATGVMAAMFGADFVRRVAAGEVPFDSPEIGVWSAALQELHDKHLVTIFDFPVVAGWMPGVACAFHFATRLGNLGLKHEDYLVFYLPPYDKPVSGLSTPLLSADTITTTALFYWLFLPKRGIHIDQGEEIVRSFVIESRKQFRIDQLNYFSKPDLSIPVVPSRMYADVDERQVYAIDGIVEPLSTILKPEFTKQVSKVIGTRLWRGNATHPVHVDVQALFASVENLRVEIILGKVTQPTLRPPPGVFRKSVTFAVSSRTPGATHFYTLDGTDPSQGGLPYSGPITLGPGTHILQMRSVAEGLASSTPISATYVVEKPSHTVTAIVASVCGIVMIIGAITGVLLYRRKQVTLTDIPANDIKFHSIVGVGSRGLIFSGVYQHVDVAVKVYMTKDDMDAILSSAQLKNGVEGVRGASTKEAHVTVDIPGTVSDTEVSATHGGQALVPGLGHVDVGNVGAGALTSTSSYFGKLTSTVTSTGSARTLLSTTRSETKYSPKNAKKASARTFSKELAVISKLRSPNLVDVYGTCSLPNGTRGIVLEYMSGGSLYDLVHNTAVEMGMKRRMDLAINAARALAYLHAQSPPLIHRDVKSLNYLLGPRRECKISDFDLTVRAGPDGVTRSSGPDVSLGTIPWTAPEVFRSGGTEHSTVSDVYALGIVLWELMSREDPHPGLDAPQIQAFVLHGGRPEIPDNTPLRLATLIRKCWAQDPCKRPSVAEVVDELVDIWSDTPEDIANEQAPGRSIACATALLGAEQVKALQRAVISGSRPDPVLISKAAVVFTDIVSFTKISSTLEPTKVASMISRLFARFDRILDVHDGILYKTIGDAYICIVPNGGCAERAVAIGLDMADAAKGVLVDEDNSAGPYVQIRIGCHIGSFAAQIMDMCTVDILGDTMNFASRLETLGKPNMVHISQDLKDAVSAVSHITTVPRQAIEVKGKGRVNTFFAKRK